jgi:hypothetical protein
VTWDAEDWEDNEWQPDFPDMEWEDSDVTVETMESDRAMLEAAAEEERAMYFQVPQAQHEGNMGLASVALAALAAAAAAVMYAWRRHVGTASERQALAMASVGGQFSHPSRYSLRPLYARGDDEPQFDPSLLKGSGWGTDLGNLQGASGGLDLGGGAGPLGGGAGGPGSDALKTLDDIPPTDNSGFAQSGGFGWDSESGEYDHISRRLKQRGQAQAEKKEAEQKEERRAVVEEITQRRNARVLPTAESSPQEVLQYLLDTVTDDLAYEITRVRPYINDAFWAHLDKLMEEERMKEDYSEAGEDGEKPVTMLGNYEVLKALIEITFAKLDAATEYLMGPQERLKKLLESKDKKAMILEMAGNNEIDEDLLDLLKTNQANAQVAGAQQVADFLGKVHDECKRFVTA